MNDAAGQRHAWVSAGLGIAQISSGTWLLVLWLVGAPRWSLLLLVVVSLALGAVSLLRRHGRPLAKPTDLKGK